MTVLNKPNDTPLLYTMAADQKGIEKVTFLEILNGNQRARVLGDDGNEYVIAFTTGLYNRLTRFAHDNQIDLYDPKQVPMIELRLDKQRSFDYQIGTSRTWQPALKR